MRRLRRREKIRNQHLDVEGLLKGFAFVCEKGFLDEVKEGFKPSF
jgi:hypothetical protein